jgi:hypothetical protein
MHIHAVLGGDWVKWRDVGDHSATTYTAPWSDSQNVSGKIKINVEDLPSQPSCQQTSEQFTQAKPALRHLHPK